MSKRRIHPITSAKRATQKTRKTHFVRILFLIYPSPIQTVTVGSGVSPESTAYSGSRACATEVAITAGREFHPAPKDKNDLIKIEYI